MAKEAKTASGGDIQPTEAQQYEAAEIAKNAQHLLGYGVDVATAAFDFNHITSCTLTEAKRLVGEFAKRKVN